MSEFEEIMLLQGTIPLAQKNAKVLVHSSLKKSIKKAIPVHNARENCSSSSLIPWRDALSERECFSKNGINKRLLRQLRKIKPSLELDLHGYIIDDARTVLFDFLSDAQQQDHKAVLVIHGKGHGSKNGIGVLQQCVRAWLYQAHHVFYFENQHNNSGATLVFLKKNPRST